MTKRLLQLEGTLMAYALQRLVRAQERGGPEYLSKTAARACLHAGLIEWSTGRRKKLRLTSMGKAHLAIAALSGPEKSEGV